MHRFLDFLLLVFYVLCIIGGAAAVTALVVRISPTKDPKATSDRG